MKRIKYAIFLLCSFAVLISLSGCRKSSENIKILDFQQNIKKIIKILSLIQKLLLEKKDKNFYMKVVPKKSNLIQKRYKIKFFL